MEITDNIKDSAKREKPTWYKMIKLLNLIPTLSIWPILFFMSIFIFDNPKNMIEAWLLFFGINGIPILFIALLFLSNRLFERYKYISIMLSFIPLVCITLFVFLLFKG